MDKSRVNNFSRYFSYFTRWQCSFSSFLLPFHSQLTCKLWFHSENGSWRPLQLISNDGTSVDPASPTPPVSNQAKSYPNATTTNLDETLYSQTLPKTKSNVKRSVAFATLPSPYKKTDIKTDVTPIVNYSTHPAMKESPISPGDDSKYENNTNDSTINPTRFRLPPTPLTSPGPIGDSGTSTSINTRQIARSVQGQWLTEVGLNRMQVY